MTCTCIHVFMVTQFTDTSKSQEDEYRSTCSDTTVTFDEVVNEPNQLCEDCVIVEVAEVSAVTSNCVYRSLVNVC